MLLKYEDDDSIWKSYPFSEICKSVIIKSGEKDLLIRTILNNGGSRDKIFTLENKLFSKVLSTESDNHSFQDMGIVVNFVTHYSGKVSKELITITMDIEGVWKITMPEVMGGKSQGKVIGNGTMILKR